MSLVAMSGYAFANVDAPAPDFLRMALELGATRYVRKPFTPPALLTVIDECRAEAGCRFACAAQQSWPPFGLCDASIAQAPFRICLP